MPASSATSGYMATVRSLSRDTRLVLASQAVVSVVNAFWGVLSNLYLLRLGYGPEFVGVANFVMLAGTALFSLPGGALNRRIGSRNSLLVGTGAWAAAYAAYVCAWLLPVEMRQPWLLATALLDGAGYALLAVSISPLFMACVSSEQRGHAFSLYHAAGTSVSFMASLVAGVLPGIFAGIVGMSVDAPGPYGLSLLVGAGLLLPSALLASRVHAPKESAEDPGPVGPVYAPEPTRSAVPWRLLLPVAMVLFLGWLGQGTIVVFWNVFLDRGLHLATPLIGTISAIGYTVAVPAALMAPVAMQRFGRHRTYPLALLGGAASIALLGFAPGAAVAAFALAARYAFFSISSPTITAISQSSVPPRWRGTMSAVVNMALTVGRGITALVGGAVVASAGYRPLFVGGALIVVTAATVFWFWLRPAAGLADVIERR
ncbi:MAG: MFS transporter [Anaerolineae bacterium]